MLSQEGQIGFSSTTNPERERELVDRVGDLAPFGSSAKFEFPAQQEIPSIPTYDSAIENVTNEQLIEKGQRLLDAVLTKWPEALCDIRFGRSIAEESVENSAGVERSYKHSGYYVAIGVQLIRGTDMLNVWESHSSHNVFGQDVEEHVLNEVLRALDNSRELANAPAGDVPVLFTPQGVAATLLDPAAVGIQRQERGYRLIADHWT